MPRVVLSVVITLLGACASAPPPRPVALDPSNPNAPESPPASISPIAMRAADPEPASEPAPAAAEPAAAEPAAAEPAAAHEHQHGDSPPDPGAKAGTKPVTKPAKAPSKAPDTKADENAAQAYTCPMHPEVVSPTPGKCPKCGMKLVPKAPEPKGKK